MNLTRRSALAGAFAVATTNVAWADDASVRVFPFQFVSNRAIVPVYINRKGPFRFLVDSGASDLNMSVKELQALGLPIIGAELRGAAAGVIRSDLYRASEVIIGDSLIIRNASVGTMTSQGRDEPVGLLPLYGLHQSVMDFATRKLTVFVQPSGPPPGMVLYPTGHASSHLASERATDTRPFMTAFVFGKRAKVLVDTGYSGTLILKSRFVRDNGLADKFDGGQSVTLTTPTGLTHASAIKADRIEFADQTFKDQVVQLSDPSITNKADDGDDSDGTLGMEILRRFDLWTDARTGTMGFKPNAMFNEPQRVDRSGLHVAYDNTEEDRLRVIGIVRGSIADQAGLRVGDEIRAFSGGGGRDELVWALSGPPGSKVAIKYAHQDVEQIVTLVLGDPR